jgi:hypothetical protein
LANVYAFANIVKISLPCHNENISWKGDYTR